MELADYWQMILDVPISTLQPIDLQAKMGNVVGATDYLFSPIDEDLLKFKGATYAKMYLRNEAVLREIHELRVAMDELRSELGLARPSDQVRERIRELEGRIEDLERRLEYAPG